MKAALTHPSWHQLERGSAILANMILRWWEIGVVPNPEQVQIIGVARGGVFPALLISHTLDLPMTCVSYSSRKGTGDDKNHDNFLPTMERLQLIIVDDICDSGRTLDEIKNHYTQEGHTVYTAALYHKPNSFHCPNFVWREEDKNSPWIEFPWEV